MVALDRRTATIEPTSEHRQSGDEPETDPSADLRTGMLVDHWQAALIGLVIAVLTPLLLGGVGILNDYRANLVGTAAAFAVAGLSLNVLMGYAGQLSLGHFALVGVGAFTASKVTNPFDLRQPFFVGLIAAVAIGAAVGAFIGLPSLRIRGLYLAIVSVGFQYAMEKSVFPSSALAGGSGGVELPRPYIGGFEFRSNAHYLAILTGLVALVWLVDRNLTSSRIGRAFHAVRADEDIASSFGVNVNRTKMLAYSISGGMAGLAGAMYGGLVQFANADTFRFQQSLLLVVIVVIGGLGSRPGIVVAAAFFGVMPLIFDGLAEVDAIRSTLFFGDPDGFEFMIGSALLIFTVAKNPRGLAGAVLEQREKREEAEARTRAAEDVDDESVASIPNFPLLDEPSGLPPRKRLSEGNVFSAKGITVDFGGLRAVDQASIDVPKNKIVGLIGPNGAGKTTLFNAISGAVTPSQGRLLLSGHDCGMLPAHWRARLGISRTFQSIGLARERSLLENLLLAQHLVARYDTLSGLLGVGRAPRVERELLERAHSTIAALDFEQFTHTPVMNLSGGQQRIAEVACCLVTAPELMMLDEPSAGMAPAAVENLAERLREMRDDLGQTILLIEHNIPLVLDVCDEVYVMVNGAVIAHGTPDEVVGDPEVITAYLGTGA